LKITSRSSEFLFIPKSLYIKQYNSITMVMDTIQIRLMPVLVERIDTLVKTGVYGSRSDAIRDAVRHFFWHNEAGTISKKGQSVEVVRKARRQLSKQKINLAEINKF